MKRVQLKREVLNMYGLFDLMLLVAKRGFVSRRYIIYTCILIDVNAPFVDTNNNNSRNNNSEKLLTKMMLMSTTFSKHTNPKYIYYILIK